MKVTSFENSLFNSISYLIEIGENMILIDPSDDDKLIELIEHAKSKPSYIFLTHEHIDHILGIVKLKEKYTDIILIATEQTSKSVLDPKKNLSIFHGFEFVGIEADLKINNKHELEIGETKVHLFPCKGHSKGGMFVNINNIVFTGDEFIFETKTVTKLPGGNLNELYNSYGFLKTKFADDTILYPGHGQHFNINELKIWEK